LVRQTRSERPWAQGCVIAVAGTALATTSCFGFLLTLDLNSGSSKLGEVANVVIAVVFGLSALANPVGFIWFIVGAGEERDQGPHSSSSCAAFRAAARSGGPG